MSSPKAMDEDTPNNSPSKSPNINEIAERGTDTKNEILDDEDRDDSTPLTPLTPLTEKRSVAPPRRRTSSSRSKLPGTSIRRNVMYVNIYFIYKLYI